MQIDDDALVCLLYGNDWSQIQIARKCSARESGCYLDEFLKYIQAVSRGETKWQGSTTAGTDLNPNVEEIVSELKAQGYNTERQNWYRLLPSEFTPNAVATFSQGYTKIMNRIQTMRADAAARGVDIGFELKNIRYSIIQTAAGRTMDNAAWLIKHLNEITAKAGYSWIRSTFHVNLNAFCRIRSNPLLIQIQQTIATTPAKDGHGNEWSKPDLAKTLADHANDGNNNNQKPLTDDLKSRLATFVTDYGSEDSEESKSVTHYNAMQASRVFQDTLKSDKTCQVKLPESWWGGA